MYSILVLQCGIAPGYVLDEMKFYEIEALISNMWMKDKENWEQTRMLSYITAQVNSSKPIELTEIMNFPWEKETNTSQVDTEEDMNKIMEEMKNIENKMNNING